MRRALVELVAENGFRGTAMAAVAERAGVATGTAYVHYKSKDDLVLAAYLEVKQSVAGAAAAAGNGGDTREQLFNRIWYAIYAHLSADPVQAQFLVQVEASPYAAIAHDSAMSAGVMLDQHAFVEVMHALVSLPPLILWDMGMGPAIRAAASGIRLSKAELAELAAACWRAVSKPA